MVKNSVLMLLGLLMIYLSASFMPFSNPTNFADWMWHLINATSLASGLIPISLGATFTALDWMET